MPRMLDRLTQHALTTWKPVRTSSFFLPFYAPKMAKIPQKKPKMAKYWSILLHIDQFYALFGQKTQKVG